MSETPQPPQEAAFFSAIRGWNIQRGDGILGGVASGLGARVGMAPVPARLLMVLAGILLNGLVLLAYAAAWALLPDRRGAIVIQDFGRGVTNVGALIGIAVMGVLGFVTLDNGGLFGGVFGGDVFPWDRLSNFGPFEFVAAFFGVMIPLAILGGLVFLIVYLVRRNKAGSVHTGPGGTYWTSQASAPHGATPPPYAGAASAGEASSDAPAPADASAQSTGAAEDSGDGEPRDTATEPGETPTSPAAGAAAAAATAATASATATGQPQPWEHALLPGDPRASVPGGTHQGRPNPRHGTPQAQHQAGAWTGSGGSAYSWNATTGQQAPVPPAYAPPRPPKPARVPGPGKAAWLAFLGVLVIAVAVVFAIDRSDQLVIDPVLAWGSAITIGLGAVLLVVALSGRRLGFLGFLSVCAVLISIPLVANADELRERYADGWDWIDGTVTYEEEYGTTEDTVDEGPAEISIREAFGDDYSTIFAAGACYYYADSEDGDLFGPSDSYVQLDSVDEDTSIKLRGSTSEVVMPAGTSLSVTAADSVTVEFPDRDLWCDLWNDGSSNSTVLDLTASGTPVLTLKSAESSTITIIEEVTP
ncbi:MAG: PspC domain-containing protein [Demequina sp.]|uniref:PspC domain-containing protein n=1 Tax=Demequina sp. TaxID=2050685 RepID=UPI003A898FDC